MNDFEALRHEYDDIQRQIEQASLRAFLVPLLDLDLTMQQLRVLIILVTSGDDGATGQQVAKALGVSLATVSGIMDHLETAGVAARSIDDDDHRVRRLRATALGRRKAHALATAQSGAAASPVDRLSPADLAALVRGMRAVLAVLREPS